MQNKVKPLHHKLEQTTKEVSEAEVRMKLLDEKRKNLNSRLQDLSNNFEQATLDRYNQEIKSSKVTEMLVTSKCLIELLENEKENALILKSSYKKRRSHIIGSCAISAGFVTYLGQFDMVSRREIMTTQWPRCLQERGLNLLFDIVDKVEGLKVLFEYPSLNQNSSRENENPIQDSQSQNTFSSKGNANIPTLTDDQYLNFVTAIGSLVLNKRKDDYLKLESFLNFDIQQSILIAGNEDRFTIIVDPSNYGMAFYNKNWKIFNKIFSGPVHFDKENNCPIIDIDLITPQIFSNRLDEAIINGFHSIIHTEQVKLDVFVESLIQFFSSKCIENQEYDSRLIQLGSRRLFAEEGFRSILVSSQSYLPNDNELYAMTNLINWKVTEDHLIDIMSEKCFMNIGDNLSKVQSRKRMNEENRHHLSTLMLELHSILIKTNRSTGKLWNNENIELLKMIINDIKSVKTKINNYNQFVKQTNHHKSNIKRQLMRLELMIQCLTNMGKINSNISFTPTIYLGIFERILSENSEFEYGSSSNKSESSDNASDSNLIGQTSTTVMSGKIDEESILKWSSSDQVPNFQTNEEDDKYLVEQLLNSIDSEEKKFLAQEITGIRSSKNQFKLKSFEFYMQRRGVIRPRPWKPHTTKPHQENLLAILQQDQIELIEKVKHIQNITNQIEASSEPGDGVDVQFKLLTEDNIRNIVTMFESEVLQRLQLCLSHDEFLVYRFIYYLWLSEDPVNSPSSMELEFFIHGSLKPEMKLSLADFDCFNGIPNWIPNHVWEEVLAASVLPGPLGELCVKVAENSEKWKTWYDQDDVENSDQTPLDEVSDQTEDIASKIPTNKFIKLILLRIFRPDRCAIMMDNILGKYLSKSEMSFNFQDIISHYPKMKCILISRNIIPSPDCLSIDSFENDDLILAIQQLSKNQSVTSSFVNCATVSYDHLYGILENDSRKSNWVVVSITEQNILRTLLDKWSFNVKSKTSLWSTDYEPSCQTDFNEYEFCILFKLTQLKSKVMLIYKCNRPLKNLIIITPILRTEYEFEYRLGEVYKIKNDLNSNFKEYQDKVDRHLKMYQTNNISMPTCSNFGSFLILKDNSFPYAITSNNDVIFVVSDIGKGRVGFIACDGITDDYGPFKDFLRTIYGEYYVNAVILTENIIQMLHDDIVKGKQITIQLIWNAHYEIKESSVKQLLDLIKYGLKIVIGLKPWAYNNYLKKLEESELLMLFKAAGIWPSLKALNVNLTRTNRDKIAAFSLNHQLGYAKTSLENLKAISESIVNIVINSPFQIIGTKSEFLEVTKSIQEILQMYSPYVKSMIPCLKNIVKEKTMKDLIYVYNALLIYPFNEPTVAPGVSFYPGKFQSDNFQPLTIEMYLYLKFKDEIFQLGLYLPPGKSATVQLKSSRSQTCVLHLNFHLFDVYFKDEYYKWPTSKKSILLNINTVETFSFSFGGLLSISCASDNNVVDIVFSGVIQVPVYDRRDPDNNKNWMILQKSKAPWAILAGDSFVFVVSINTVRNLAQPNKVLELFDLMVNEQHHLRGLSVEGKPRETISTDIQIELGYMHSGYPIGTMIQHVTNPSEKSKFLFDFDNIRIEGRWGVLHEIGHNLQDSSFTFTGTVDVTNNIFTLIGVESATGKSSWSNNEGWASDRSYIERFVSYLKKGNFNEWKNEPFLALGVYAQLRSNFEWELYYQVFRQYNTIAESIKRMSDTEKIQQWIILTSIHAKMNLCPLYDFWRWPVDPKTNQQLLKYPYFFPDDFLTNLVPEAVDNIIIKYGGSLNVKRLPVKLEEKIGPLKGKTSVKGDKIIEKIMILN